MDLGKGSRLASACHAQVRKRCRDERPVFCKRLACSRCVRRARFLWRAEARPRHHERPMWLLRLRRRGAPKAHGPFLGCGGQRHQSDLGSHSLRAPATCETWSCTPCAEHQEAIRQRKADKGQAVVNSLLTPPSVGVLSLPEGRQILRWEQACRSRAHMAKASWAKASKQAIYFWASLDIKGQSERTSDMSKDSENQPMPDFVVIQPPMPTVDPSAMASARARQGKRGGKVRGVVGIVSVRYSSILVSGNNIFQLTNQSQYVLLPINWYNN